jgi:dihydrofolate reductase
VAKLKLYIATSLDGKIAKPDGNVDWLHEIPNPDKSDYGYFAFYDGIGITLQGYHTYQFILDSGVDFPYVGKKNYVFTRKTGLPTTEQVEFVNGDIISFTQKLKEEAQEDIWLIGGGQINTLLWNAGLIDEMQVFVMPIVLGEGIPLFAPHPQEGMLALQESQAFASGAVLLRYGQA